MYSGRAVQHTGSSTETICVVLGFFQFCLLVLVSTKYFIWLFNIFSVYDTEVSLIKLHLVMKYCTTGKIENSVFPLQLTTSHEHYLLELYFKFYIGFSM